MLIDSIKADLRDRQHLLQENSADHVRLATPFLEWSNSEERREVGVGFALRTDAISKRTNLSKRFNNCLMTLRHHYQYICTNNDESRRPMINSRSIWKT